MKLNCPSSLTGLPYEDVSIVDPYIFLMYNISLTLCSPNIGSWLSHHLSRFYKVTTVLRH